MKRARGSAHPGAAAVALRAGVAPLVCLVLSLTLTLAGDSEDRELAALGPETPRPEPPPLTSLFLNRASAEHLGVSLPAGALARARRIFPQP